MKIKRIELGDSKDKPDTAFLWDKAHRTPIILRYSFEELNKPVEEQTGKQ